MRPSPKPSYTSGLSFARTRPSLATGASDVSFGAVASSGFEVDVENGVGVGIGLGLVLVSVAGIGLGIGFGAMELVLLFGWRSEKRLSARLSSGGVGFDDDRTVLLPSCENFSRSGVRCRTSPLLGVPRPRPGSARASSPVWRLVADGILLSETLRGCSVAAGISGTDGDSGRWSPGPICALTARRRLRRGAEVTGDVTDRFSTGGVSDRSEAEDAGIGDTLPFASRPKPIPVMAP